MTEAELDVLVYYERAYMVALGQNASGPALFSRVEEIGVVCDLMAREAVERRRAFMQELLGEPNEGDEKD